MLSLPARRTRRTSPVLWSGWVVALSLATSGCSVFGSDSDSVNVTAIQPEQCFVAPADEGDRDGLIRDLARVPCEEPHDYEAFARIPYEPAQEPADPLAFPGGAKLEEFAQGACAEAFRDYVGIDYLDADGLWTTQLLPSARSWNDGRSEVICFIVAAGRQLEGSQKDMAEEE